MLQITKYKIYGSIGIVSFLLIPMALIYLALFHEIIPNKIIEVIPIITIFISGVCAFTSTRAIKLHIDIFH